MKYFRLVLIWTAFYSPAHADQGGWMFSVGCPTVGMQTGNFSFGASKGSFYVPSCATCCTRTPTSFTKQTLSQCCVGGTPGPTCTLGTAGSSCLGGVPRSTTFYGLSMGDILITPPILNTEFQPIFTVNSACPVLVAAKTVNWITSQWRDSDLTLTNLALVGEARIAVNGQVTLTGQWDVAGAPFWLGNVSVPGTECSEGKAVATGAHNLAGNIYYSGRASGVFKSSPGQASFFFPQQTALTSDLAGHVYSGITFDSRSLGANDASDVRNVRAVSDGTGSIFVIEPYSDPSTGVLDSSASGYTYTMTLQSLNNPKPGMVLGVIKKCAPLRGSATGVFDPSKTCTNPLSQPDLGRVVCITNTNGNFGTRLMCSGESPSSNATPFHISLHYKASAGADTGFGSNGSVITPVGTGNDYGNALAIQADGKAVVAGTSYNSTTGDNVAVVRYNTDGSLDTSFNGTGKVVTALSNANDGAGAVALQADGKIVVGGYAANPTQWDFAVVRYNSDGTLDTTFNGTGSVMTPIGTSHDAITALSIQSDGKIVAGGYSYSGTKYIFSVARYNSNGSLDTTFSGDGKQTADFGVDDNEGFGMAIQSDGKIVAAGFYFNGSARDFAVVRYLANGNLDTTFSGDGKQTTHISTDDTARDVVIQTDGKILVGGISYSGVGEGQYTLVRYTTAGNLDTTFNGTGKVVSNLTPSNDYIFGLALQTDGKIIAAGQGSNDFAVARYNTNGTLDTSFNGTGKIITAVGTGVDHARDVAIAPDGKIISAGAALALDGQSYDFALIRYSP